MMNKLGQARTLLKLRYILEKSNYHNIFLVLATLVVSTWISFWAFRESPRTVLRNSIALDGDGALIGQFIKLVNENSYSAILQSRITSSNLGWPGQLDFSAFPVGQLGDTLLVKIFSQISNISDPGTLIHIFSILKVIPICLAVIILGRTLKISYLSSGIIAIAYSISTYNLVRAEGHFFLGLTWNIPLGLAAIVIAFRVANGTQSKEPFRFGNKAKLLALIIPVAISTFYYAFFIALLAGAIFVLLLIKEFLDFRSSQKRVFSVELLKDGLSRLQGFLFIGFSIVAGIVSQLTWAFTHNKSFALTGIADRSPIESVIYGGTFEGFFYDSGQLVLNLVKRQDLLNFMASRVSWEGAQVGAFAGFAVYALIIFGFIQLVNVKVINKQHTQSKNLIRLNSELWLTSTLLFLAALLYIIGPVNFGISRIIPEIRAWGRISSVLTLLILTVTALLVETYFKKFALKGVVLLLILVIPLSEVYFFRSYRPISSSAALSVQTINNLRETSLKELKLIYQKNCPIFLAPLYPFPEYERADDNNFDYSQLSLPLLDDGYFRWSAAGIKSTLNFKAWQPLTSVQPNFARANIAYQLEYARSLGACGSVVDRTLLTETESKDLSAYLFDQNTFCLKNLLGEEFGGSSRFLSIAYNAPNCERQVNPNIDNFAKSNLQSEILWQIDQPYGLKYLDQWQIFPSSSPIGLRLVEFTNANRTLNFFKIRVSPIESKVPFTSLTVCARSIGSIEGSCHALRVGKENSMQLQIRSEYLSNTLQKIELYLKPESAALIENWGVVIENKTKS